MVIMHGLRILADLSFYYAFASFVSVCCGGRYAMLALLLQTACFTASSVVEKKKALRLAALLPMVLFFFLPGINLADMIAFLPPAVYLCRLVYKGDYTLDWGRHVELFNTFWKFYMVIACILLMVGVLAQLTAASLPIALIMLVSSVLLMRSLRHEPETYCQKWYQLANAAAVALVIVVAWAVSSEAFLNACLTMLSVTYNKLALPLLMALLMVFVCVLQAFSWLVSLLNIPLPKDMEFPELVQLDSLVRDLGLDMTEGDPVGGGFMVLLIALILAALLYLFFRWMSRIGWGNITPPDAREERTEMKDEGGKKVRPPRPGNAVQRVRAQYRKFLKLYLAEGGELDDAHTSQDVAYEARRRKFSADTTEELRDIYIRARYGEQAENTDVARAKELFHAMKKERRR